MIRWLIKFNKQIINSNAVRIASCIFYLPWESENSGIESPLLDSRYDSKKLNEHMKHSNCAV